MDAAFSRYSVTTGDIPLSNLLPIAMAEASKLIAFTTTGATAALEQALREGINRSG